MLRWQWPLKQILTKEQNTITLGQIFQLMKKQFSILFALLVIGFLLFLSCSKSEGDGIAPTYKSEGTSTGNNPYTPPSTT
jgi:hypothetical protein